ncbi:MULTISPECIES: hypothetical protein [unclassified Paenibacillus]|uniref:hypothetical protein n=1 Tax=unclassified Paenibacillus TaxID=185978 RepID=UPI001C40B2A4|nr:MULTISPECIES: hypothetical protein [unclassified Paenibacillus]
MFWNKCLPKFTQSIDWNNIGDITWRGVQHVKSRTKYSIWIEAEQWAEGWNESDAISDVLVSFDDGTEWIASLFTYRNIETLICKNRISGECLKGDYFWSSNMILVAEISRPRIEELVNHLLINGEFSSIFKLVE